MVPHEVIQFRLAVVFLLEIEEVKLLNSMDLL